MIAKISESTLIIDACIEMNTACVLTPAPKGASKTTKVGMSLSGSLAKKTIRAKISVQSKIVKEKPTAMQKIVMKNPKSGIV